MRIDLAFLRDPARLAAISTLAVCGAVMAVWLIARGDLVGADARAYWGGVRLWLGGGDPLDPPPPYMPYVYFPWSLPLLVPWAALPWETAWFVYRVVNIVLFAWSAWWAYQRHPRATALLVLLVTPAMVATLDTGNITFLCAMGIWAAHFVGPRLGGFLWALVAALKWFPVLLFVVLPPRARLWGIAWAALLGLLTLAEWPAVVRQVDIVLGFPRPLRIDYTLLLWAAVPWLWARPALFEWRAWARRLHGARLDALAACRRWWDGERRVSVAREAIVERSKAFLGLG